MTRSPFALLALVILLITAACSSVGPKTISRDQFDYAEAMRDSWKEQMLLNMVGLRYAEAPLFLRVTSLINQYTIVGLASLAAPPYELQAAAAPPVGISGRYSDRPTITYTPLTGAEYTRSVMTPIPPTTIMSMIQAGWRTDILFHLAVRSINGIAPTQRIGALAGREGFHEVVAILGRLQDAGGLSFRVEKRGPERAAIIVLPNSDAEALSAERERLGELLGLETGRSEYSLIFGQHPRNTGEVAIITRSVLEMLIDLAMWIEVPAEHVASGRTRPSFDPQPLKNFGFRPPIRVHSSDQPPESAFVAVRYDGVWYWIDHRDFRSKRTLSFMQLLFSLAESGDGQQAPVVTVQAGG